MKIRLLILKSIIFYIYLICASSLSQTTTFEGVWYLADDLDNSIEIINNTDTYTIVTLKRGKERWRDKFNGKLNNETLELYRIEDKSTPIRITFNSKGRLLINGEKTFITKDEYLELEKKEVAKTKREAKEVEKVVKSRFLDVINSYQKRNKNAEYFINEMKNKNEISQVDYDKFQEILQTPTEFEITKESATNFMESQKSVEKLISNTLLAFKKYPSLYKSQEYLIALDKSQKMNGSVKFSVSRYNQSFSRYSEYIDLPLIKLN